MVLLRTFSALNICKSKIEIEIRFEQGDSQKMMRFYDSVHGAQRKFFPILAVFKQLQILDRHCT